MGDRGYLYVLANSSMVDLVKVGKTTRQPSQRAQELSCVTGLPTPFIVVYEQLFEDCATAEEFVHAVLARKGFRVAENREFFRAPVNDVIRAIAQAPGAIHDSADSNAAEEMDVFESRQHDATDDEKLPSDRMAYPWSDSWYEALSNYVGSGDSLRDYEAAISLYEEAAKLGCIMAYSQLGRMYREGEGVPEDHSKALKYYKQGASKGNYFCYIYMAKMFLDKKDPENYRKCVRLFFENRKNEKGLLFEPQFSFAHECFEYVHLCLKRSIAPEIVSLPHLKSVKEEMINCGMKAKSLLLEVYDDDADGLKSDPKYKAALESCLSDVEKSMDWVRQL